MSGRARILNGRFDRFTLSQTVDAIFDLLRTGRRGWVCTVNVATLMAMRDDPTLQSFVDRAAIVVADGQPLVWCAPLFDDRVPERVTGIDLVDALCERAAETNTGVYLLGSTDAFLDRALADLRRRHRGLRITGANGYFDEGDAEGRANAIAGSGAGILLVGMGSPRQEAFIQRTWAGLGVGVAMGVGGSFDVLAGARFRAPVAMRRAGLEWLVRMVQEPRRLMRRYLCTNTRFCLLIADALFVRFKRWLRAT